MFKLTDEESKITWFQIKIKSEKKETPDGKYSNPYDFSKSLATVLKIILFMIDF